MVTFHFEHGLSDSVTVNLSGQKVRWCIITAVKFEDKNIKCDVQLPEGGKLYDVDSSRITSTASEGEAALLNKF